MQRSDRREWAVLGLVALAWALLVAPVLHQQTHAHGEKHSHGPAQQQHGAGSFEHQAVAFIEPELVVEPVGVWVALNTATERAPVDSSVAARRRVEQSQAP